MADDSNSNPTVDEVILEQFREPLSLPRGPAPVFLENIPIDDSQKWRRSVIISVLSNGKTRPAGLKEWIKKMWNPGNPLSLLDYPNNAFILQLQSEEEVDKICRRTT